MYIFEREKDPFHYATCNTTITNNKELQYLPDNILNSSFTHCVWKVFFLE